MHMRPGLPCACSMLQLLHCTLMRAAIALLPICNVCVSGSAHSLVCPRSASAPAFLWQAVGWNWDRRIVSLCGLYCVGLCSVGRVQCGAYAPA